MARYKDTGDQCPQESGIERYQSGSDYIDITFKSGGTYRYTATRLGKRAIDQMKILARQGDCLNTWLNQHREVWKSGTLT
jgi:hypothetical protein